MGKVAPTPETIKIADLAADRSIEIALEPDAAGRDAIAAELGLRGLKKLRFQGKLSPLGKADWQLEAQLGATVVQDCVVTLDPVTTRIDEAMTRSYLADIPELAESEEIEMPEDDTVEPLPETLNLAAVMIETLALALPAYPRADGATDPVNQTFAAPGVQPMRDEDAKPFAGLQALKDKLSNDKES